MDNLVYHIAKAYGSEMIYSRRVRNFRNKDNERTVYLPWHGPSDEEGRDCIGNGIADSRLALLIEDSREAIRTKGFKVLYVEKNGFNLIRRGNSAELGIFVFCDTWEDKMLEMRGKVKLTLLKKVLEVLKERSSNGVALSDP